MDQGLRLLRRAARGRPNDPDGDVQDDVRCARRRAQGLQRQAASSPTTIPGSRHETAAAGSQDRPRRGERPSPSISAEKAAVTRRALRIGDGPSNSRRRPPAYGRQWRRSIRLSCPMQSAGTPGLAQRRTMQRNPRCEVEVSIGWAHRAAGR